MEKSSFSTAFQNAIQLPCERVLPTSYGSVDTQQGSDFFMLRCLFQNYK